MEVLVVTQNPALADHLQSLVRSVGARAETQASMPTRTPAVLTLVDAAIDPSGAAVAGPGRPRVVVTADLDAERVAWRRAQLWEAESVVPVPEGDDWLIQRVVQAVEPASARAEVLALVGAGEGAGASVLAAALAQRASAAGHSTLLIDGADRGGDLSRLLVMHDLPGARWPDFADISGQLRPHSFAQALPALGQLRVLSWPGGPDAAAAPVASRQAVTAVLGAARSAFDRVVVDLPRDPGDEWAFPLPRRVLVARGSDRALAAAAGLAEDDDEVLIRYDRGDKAGTLAVADELGLARAHLLRSSAFVRREVDAGRGVPTGERGLRRAAAALGWS